jgi:hypothetical protein
MAYVKQTNETIYMSFVHREIKKHDRAKGKTKINSYLTHSAIEGGRGNGWRRVVIHLLINQLLLLQIVQVKSILIDAGLDAQGQLLLVRGVVNLTSLNWELKVMFLITILPTAI